MRQFRPVHLAALLFTIALYIGARCWGLTASCLWFDEIFSVHAAEHSWKELFSFVALDLIHPPLFYVLLKIWIGIGGDTLFWLRSLPFLFAIAGVAPFLCLCRELKIDRWASVLALFLFAINGNLIKYAQEVRMYSLLLLLSLISVWLFVRFFRRGPGLVALIIVNFLMVYAHYFGWFVIIGEVAAIIMLQRERWRQAVAMTGIVVLGFLPWAIAVAQAAAVGASLGQNIGWMARPNVREIVHFLLALIEPFYYQASSVDPASIYEVSVPLLLIGIGAIALYFYSWRKSSDEEKQTSRMLILSVCVPVGLAFFASWLFPYSLWGTRHLIVVFAPFLILLAAAIVNIPIRASRTAAVTLVLLFSGLALVNAARAPEPVYSWCNWEPLAIRAAQETPAKIYAFEDAVVYHLWFGLRRHGANGIQVSKVSNVPGVIDDAAYFLPRGFDEIKVVNVSVVREPRLWIAYRSDAVDETQQPLKTFIDAGYKMADQEVLPAKGEKTILLLMKKGS